MKQEQYKEIITRLTLIDWQLLLVIVFVALSSCPSSKAHAQVPPSPVDLCDSHFMPDFYHGDVVRVTDQYSVYYNCTGVVYGRGVSCKYLVTGLCDDHAFSNFSGTDLKLVKKGNRK